MTDHTEVQRLEAVRSLGLLDTPPEERFDRIVRLARRLFDVPAALVSLVDEHRQFNKAQIGLGLDEVPISQSFCRFTIREPGALVVDDARQDARFRDNPLVRAEDDPVRFYAGHPLHEPGGNVVGALCIIDSEPRRLDDDQLEVLAELATFVEAELARGAELDRAGDVQRALLPRTRPVLAGYDVAGMCLPAHHVGGDFYDWYPVGDNGFQVVLADVMGKGVPAAILGASVRSLMRGASRFNDVETAVNRAAYSIERDLDETSSFVTVFAARFDLQSHEVTYVDAGHGIAGVVSADGDARQFESEGMPLGAPAAEPWRGERVKLEPGDTLVALSDGLLDLFESIEEAREAIRFTIAEADTAQEVVDVAAQYARDHGATDDVTAVVVRRTA